MLCTKKRYGVLQETPNIRQLWIQVAAIGILFMHSFAANVTRLYMWEKERTLKERTDEHLRDVHQQAEKPIMRHFEGHKEEQLRVTVLQRMFQEGRIYRQLAEEQWIMKLKTKIPQGCNVKLNWDQGFFFFFFGGGGGGEGRRAEGDALWGGGRRGCPVESFLLYSQLLFDCLYGLLKCFCNILDPDQDRLNFSLDQDPICLARLQ